MAEGSHARTQPRALGPAVPVHALEVLANHRGERILDAVAKSAKELLRSSDLDESLPRVLEHIGPVTGVDRAHVFAVDASSRDLGILCHHFWALPGTSTPPAPTGPPEPVPDGEFRSWLERLAQGEVIAGPAPGLNGPARALFHLGGVRSLLCVPVFADEEWWGLIRFDDCRLDREWAAAEVHTISTLAELVGAAVARMRSLKELADADCIIENSPIVLFRLDVLNPFMPIFLSRNIRRYGYDADELKNSPGRWQELIDPEDIPAIMANLQSLLEGKMERVQSEWRWIMPDGSRVWFESHASATRDGSGRVTGIEGILTDVTERKEAAEKLATLARTDPLTGLANRAAFLERLDLEFARAQRENNPFTVLYFDLDHFKDINDALGHSAGDALLVAVADRLRGCVRATDMIGRIGGDEFAVLQIGALGRKSAETMATKIGQAIAVPFSIDGNEVHTSVSIGIVPWGADIDGAAAMMISADLALYRAKEGGRNQYRLHVGELDRQARDRGILSEDLHRATERGEFELYYQPQLDLASGRVVGLEALIRWNHPERGLLMPCAFIPIAESNGTILPIGLWTAKQACRQISTWQDEGITPPVVSINVSAAQLKLAPDFDRVIERSLAEFDLDAGRLELEFTESVLMETTTRNKELFEQLNRIGVGLAIDDFGTGYSSLGYLATFRVTRLKIDARFIRGVASNPRDQTIVRATIGLAHELGLEVVAEGLEDDGQKAFLMSVGCTVAQGNYLAEPMPAARVGALLRRS